MSSSLSRLVWTHVRCCFCYVSINMWLQEIVQVRCVREARQMKKWQVRLTEGHITTFRSWTPRSRLLPAVLFLSLSFLALTLHFFCCVWAASILDSLWCQSESCTSLMRTSAWTLFTLLKGFDIEFQKGRMTSIKNIKSNINCLKKIPWSYCAKLINWRKKKNLK